MASGVRACSSLPGKSSSAIQVHLDPWGACPAARSIPHFLSRPGPLDTPSWLRSFPWGPLLQVIPFQERIKSSSLWPSPALVALSQPRAWPAPLGHRALKAIVSSNSQGQPKRHRVAQSTFHADLPHQILKPTYQLQWPGCASGSRCSGAQARIRRLGQSSAENASDTQGMVEVEQRALLGR